MYNRYVFLTVSYFRLNYYANYLQIDIRIEILVWRYVVVKIFIKCAFKNITITFYKTILFYENKFLNWNLFLLLQYLYKYLLYEKQNED